MECYLLEIINDRMMKQKLYGTLDLSELHTETVNQLMAYESTPVAGSIVTSF